MNKDVKQKWLVRVWKRGEMELKKEFTVFMYNHRLPLDINNPNQRLEIYKNSNGCIPLTADMKIIEKIERVNKLDIEQNNLIRNGGSSLYGYIVNVIRN